MRPEDGQLGGALEGRLPGQTLVEHAAERVLVGSAIHRTAFDLFRRDIGGRPDRERVLTRGAADVGEAPRETEVSQIDVPVLVEEHVRGLDVTVDEPALVGRVEGGSNLGADRERLRRLQDRLRL